MNTGLHHETLTYTAADFQGGAPAYARPSDPPPEPGTAVLASPEGTSLINEATLMFLLGLIAGLVILTGLLR